MFVVAAEELSFTRTAARLHLSKQVVSQRVARLEKAVGARLLERSTTRMHLTAAGRRVQQWAVVARDSWSELLTEVRGREAGDGPAGPPAALRVSFDADGNVSAAGDRLYREVLRVPEIIWARMPIAAALEALAADDLDLAMGSLPPGRPVPAAERVHLRTLAHGRLRVLGAEHLLRSLPERLHISDLTQLIWAVSPPHSAFHEWEKAVLAGHGVTRTAHAMDKTAEALRDGRMVGFAAPNIQPMPGMASRPIEPVYFGHWLIAWNERTVSRATAEAFHSAALSRFEHHAFRARAGDPAA